MKKIVAAVLVLLLAVGCQSATDKQYEANLQRYDAYYTAILNNDKFQGSSEYFDIFAVMNKLSDTEYRYDVIIDSPRVAMYDVEVLVIENGKSLEIADEIMPCIGLFEEHDFNLVPFQINLDAGFAEGFGLNGLVENPIVNLKVMVVWKDYAKVQQKREYFDLTVQYSEQVQE